MIFLNDYFNKLTIILLLVNIVLLIIKPIFKINIITKQKYNKLIKAINTS